MDVLYEYPPISMHGYNGRMGAWIDIRRYIHFFIKSDANKPIRPFYLSSFEYA